MNKKFISDEFSEVYKAIKNEVIWIYCHWDYYKQLFGYSPRRIDLLNETAPAFFFIIQEVLISDLITSLCKLTDTATTKIRGEEHENLSLYTLQKRLCSAPASGVEPLIESCQALLDCLKVQCEPLRVHRNKRLTHLDLKTAPCKFHESILPKIHNQTIEDALTTIARYLNMIEKYLSDNQSEYAFNVFVTHGNAEAMVAYLRYGLRYDELVSGGDISAADWDKGDWHNA